MLYIHGMGHYHPDNVLNNEFFEDLDIGTNVEWITKRVGIKERRTVFPLDYIKETCNQNAASGHDQADYDNVDTAVKATQVALDRAGLSLDDIGMVISGNSSPQYSVPCEASRIAAKLGINAPAFDLNSGCATFLFHLHWIRQMLPEALPDYVLLIIPDNMTRSVNFKDRSTAVLFGDCTVATIVSKNKVSPYCVSYSMVGSNPAAWQHVTIPTGGFIDMNGAAVQKFAIKQTITVLNDINLKTSYQFDSDYFIGHQANLRMLESICKMASIAPAKHFYNVDKFGNCGGASAPSVLSQHWGDFGPGDNLAMAVVGAGLAWGGLFLEVKS